MRTYLAAGTIAALVVLTAQPVARGQLQQQSDDSSGRSSMVESALGDSGESIFSELGSMERLDPLEADAVVGPSVEEAEAAMRAVGAQRQGQVPGVDTSRFGSGRGQPSRRQTARGGYSSRRRTEIRAKLRVGFNVIRPAPAQIGSTLAGRLEKSNWLRNQSPMQVAIEKGTAILRGTVATDHDRVLAERIARLEPGVRRVENQLTVAETPASPSPSDEPAID